MSEPLTRWDPEHQRWYRIKYNYAKPQWEFDAWLPLGWSPEPSALNTHNRRESTYGTAPNSLRSANATPPSASSETSLQHRSILPRGRGAPIYGPYNAGIGSRPGNLHYDEWDPSFFVRGKEFFAEGRVLAIILSENAGVTATSYNSSVSEVGYRGHYVLTQKRRFVVVRQRREFCFACPIFTYSGRATTKPGVQAEEHSIIYSVGHEPQLVRDEIGITKAPISVQMAQGEPPLAISSRIYYGIHHPIQYNVKVKDVGFVVERCIPILIGDWKSENMGESEQNEYVTANAEVPDRTGSAVLDEMEVDHVPKLSGDHYQQNSQNLRAEGPHNCHPGYDPREFALDCDLRKVPQENEMEDYTNQTEVDGMRGGGNNDETGLEQMDVNMKKDITPSIVHPTVKEYLTNFSGPVDSTYVPVRNPTAFFKKGRVFMTPWAEPGGFSDQPFVEIARFAVMKPSPTFSVCLRISTYSGQGTTKSGVASQHHAAVIPVGATAVRHWQGEPLLKDAIEIKVENEDITIDPMSRINFAKPYTVEHNIKVRNIGRVVGESVGRLDKYFAESLGHVKP